MVEINQCGSHVVFKESRIVPSGTSDKKSPAGSERHQLSMMPGGSRKSPSSERLQQNRSDRFPKKTVLIDEYNPGAGQRTRRKSEAKDSMGGGSQCGDRSKCLEYDGI